jgi:Tfp pilus assembly protein PilX
MKINARRGQILPMVMISMVVLTLIIFGLVQWLQNDSNWAVKQQKTTTAANLAEAAIDRGSWKLQSSTATWATVYAGGTVPGGGYNFDKTYTDVPGGTYRIKLIAGVNNQVTIWGEGRDSLKKETRSIQEVVRNQTIYSAMMSGGNVNWSKGLVIFWGPILAQGDISLQDDVVGSMYFPRKYAKGVVTGPPSGNYPRDVNGLTPPNTDSAEWWSAYSGVPNVPILDFTALRSSASASGTLNVYGCAGTGAAWDTRASCGSSGSHATHFGYPWNHPLSAQAGHSPNTDYVWYWDGDVTLSGDPGKSCGLRGTVIVRGNLTIDTPGQYNYAGHVPANAWQEENKLLINTFDTAASGEYPADLGLHQTTGTFNFGTDTFAVPGMGGGPYHTTVGIRGFTYVGGNLTIINYMDFNGALWVNGSVTASNGSIANSCGVFYNDQLQVPSLNVVLLRQSWQEVPPSQAAWP